MLTHPVRLHILHTTILQSHSLHLWLVNAEAPKLQAQQAGDQDGIPADAQADLRQLIPDQSLWWRATCIPGWMWRKVAVTEPVSTNLQLAGLCINLWDFGPVPSGKPAHSDTSADSSSKDNSQANDSQQQRATDYLQAGRIRQQQHQSITDTDALGSYQADPDVTSRTSHRKQLAAVTVTHTLLRQWGAEVLVTIHPVGWTRPKDIAGSQSGHHHGKASGQPEHLQTQAFSRLNSIWESQEGSADEGSPKLAVPSTDSSVKSLFDGHPSRQRAARTEQDSPGSDPASPGAHFPHRQTNPLCMYLPAVPACVWDSWSAQEPYFYWHSLSTSVSAC